MKSTGSNNCAAVEEEEALLFVLPDDVAAAALMAARDDVYASRESNSVAGFEGAAEAAGGAVVAVAVDVAMVILWLWSVETLEALYQAKYVAVV